MFPKSVTQASTSFSDIDLVTCAAFYSINHVLADTGVFRFKMETSTRPPGVSRNVEVLVWRQVLQRGQPRGNVPRSSSAVVGLVRVLLAR